jgi:hypothetical protein
MKTVNTVIVVSKELNFGIGGVGGIEIIHQQLVCFQMALPVILRGCWHRNRSNVVLSSTLLVTQSVKRDNPCSSWINITNNVPKLWIHTTMLNT